MGLDLLCSRTFFPIISDAKTIHGEGDMEYYLSSTQDSHTRERAAGLMRTARRCHPTIIITVEFHHTHFSLKGRLSKHLLPGGKREPRGYVLGSRDPPFRNNKETGMLREDCGLRNKRKCFRTINQGRPTTCIC